MTAEQNVPHRALNTAPGTHKSANNPGGCHGTRVTYALLHLYHTPQRPGVSTREPDFPVFSYIPQPHVLCMNYELK